MENRQWRCLNEHCFDIAREGYVNLLLANQKHSAMPGDNKLMINARRAFLDQGYYEPMANQIANLIVANNPSKHLSLHDAGCGEGYYLRQVTESLKSAGLTVESSGNDISKIAIQKAAKQYPSLSFAVASSFNLPKGDESCEAIMQVFAPSSSDEVFRILKPSGLWLLVTPGPLHLIELKRTLYTTASLHETPSQSQQGFVCLKQESLSLKLDLGDLNSRESLLQMTPFYWAAKASERRSILENMREISAEFVFTVLQKTH